MTREQMTKDAEALEKEFKESIDAMNARIREKDQQILEDLARRRQAHIEEFGRPPY